MLAVERPSDLLRNFYTLVQAHTTRTPGPSFTKLLEKAGIETIDPPTKDELDRYMSTLKKPSRNSTIFANIGKSDMPLNKGPAAIAAFAGGGFFNNIRNAVTSSTQLQVSISIAVTGMVIDLARYATRENDETTLMFLSDSSWMAMVGTWIGYDLFTHIEERRAERARAALAAELRRERFGALGEQFAAQNARLREQISIATQAVQLIEEQQVIRAAALASQPAILNITTLPISGELPLNRIAQKVDPIIYEPFKEGDVVAIVMGNMQQPVLVNGLQAWIAARPTKTPTHPTTRQEFTSLADVKIYTVTKATSGGKRTKKTRKTKKTRSKRRYV